MALAAALEIVAAEGAQALTARHVAERIGYAVGTLYNLFENRDDLLLQAKGRVLDQLHESLAALPAAGNPEQRVRTLLRGYLEFVGTQPRLWDLLFAEPTSRLDATPVWYRNKVAALMGLLEAALAPLFIGRPPEELARAAQVLWGGVQGICALAGAGRLPVVTEDSLETMTDCLLHYFLAGLRAEAAAREGVP